MSSRDDSLAITILQYNSTRFERKFQQSDFWIAYENDLLPLRL